MNGQELGRPVVFVGPSLDRGRVRSIVPDAVVLPPARCGDVLAVLRLRPSVVVLIDGFYDTVPAPWHKEILWVLEAGVPVVGAASMGALRAAELDRFGMIGVGGIYESYRDGTRTADDAVAVLQTSDGDDRALTDPLVDIEAGVASLAGRNELEGIDPEAVIAAARRQHFSERSMLGALCAAGLQPAARARVLDRFADHRRDVPTKGADAEAALCLVADGVARPAALPEPLSRTVHILRLGAAASLRPLGRPDEGLPALERLLAADEALSRAAAVAGGLLRAARASPSAVGGADARCRDAFVAARRVVRAEWDDHPAAASSAARLEWFADHVAPAETSDDVRLVVSQLVGPSAAPRLVDVLSTLAAPAIARCSDDEPSADGSALADAWLVPSTPRDALEAVAGAGRRRRAALLLDVVRLGGECTGRWQHLIDPFDAPLLDGAALVRAVS